MSDSLYGGRRLADFVLSEASGQRSRDNIVVEKPDEKTASGILLSAKANGSVVFHMRSGSTGNPGLGSVLVGNFMISGDWAVKFTSATHYTLHYPNGAIAGTGTIGTTLSVDDLGIEIISGTTAPVAGDSGVLKITSASRTYTAFTGAAGETADAILYSDLTHETGDMANAVAFVRDCEVKLHALTSLASIGAVSESNIASLSRRGIIVRDIDSRYEIHTPQLAP